MQVSYGKFIQTVIDFTIIAMAVFVSIKAINRMKKAEEAKPEPQPATPPPPSDEVLLLQEIRDLLKK